MKKESCISSFGGGGAFNSLKNSGLAAKKCYAFTLAEVLIALAIIGVVAAMTIPTFMANTAGAQFRTGFKKGITVLTQAASANYATEGYDFSGTNGAYVTTTGEGEGATTAPADLYNGAAAFTIGFNTVAKDILGDSASPSTWSDVHSDTPSLFHLFQNNLNMKNSHELANYAVMPASVGLNCESKTGGKAKVPGGPENGEAITAVEEDDLVRADLVTGATGIQGGGGLKGLCGGNPVTDGKGGINQGYMFQLEDGMVFTYDPAQAYCSEANPCFGYIDVNGPAGPNRVIACSEEGGVNAWIHTYGTKANPGNLLADCTVDAKDITDIFPVLFYGSAVKPASRAAKSVLYSKKSNQVASD